MKREHLFAAFFFAVFLFLIYQLYLCFAPFAASLVLAAVVVLTFYPLTERVVKALRGSRTLGALAMLVGVTTLVLVPTILLLSLLVSEATETYEGIQQAHPGGGADPAAGLRALAGGHLARPGGASSDPRLDRHLGHVAAGFEARLPMGRDRSRGAGTEPRGQRAQRRDDAGRALLLLPRRRPDRRAPARSDPHGARPEGADPEARLRHGDSGGPEHLPDRRDSGDRGRARLLPDRTPRDERATRIPDRRYVADPRGGRGPDLAPDRALRAGDWRNLARRRPAGSGARSRWARWTTSSVPW